jgi:hypothetical protein
VLVADGASTDGSVGLLLRAAERHGLAVDVIDNPEKHVSPGLNRCIARSRGELIVRMDCHTRYPSDYLTRCVIAAQETGADNVGGDARPRGRTPMERAVACAMASPFGGIGWSRHGDEERSEVDTVAFGAYRREAFERAGLFDETLVRDQDDEFNLRLRLAGGRVVRDPKIHSYYTPRGSLRRVFRQYYEYGFWKVSVMRKHRRVLGARSMAGGGFVTSVAVLGPLATRVRPAGGLLKLELTGYALLAILSGVAAVRARREPWRLLPRVIAVFPAFHLGHGVGMVHGWMKALRERIARPRPLIERWSRSPRHTSSPSFPRESGTLSAGPGSGSPPS